MRNAFFIFTIPNTMPLTTDLPGFFRDHFPTFSEKLRTLLLAVAENTNLLRTDFYTLQDLLELSEYHDEESLAIALLMLFVALDEGSPCLELSEASLNRRITDAVGEEPAVDVRQVLHDFQEKKFERLIDWSGRDEKPVVVHSAGDRRFLYFQKYHIHESRFWNHLQCRLSSSAPTADGDLATIVHEVLVDRPPQFETGPLQLDQNQKLAVGVALVQPFVVISGGPGTGKTSIAVTLLRCLLRTGIAPDRIALAAPTGRAAQRLTDALHAGLLHLPNEYQSEPDCGLEKMDAVTLHKLLSYHPGRGVFQRHEENPIPAEVVIVDEASMIGLVMMSHLLQALPPECNLILLGDKDQLPSVEAGAILANLLQQTDHDNTGYSPDLTDRLQQIFPDIKISPSLAFHRLQDHLVVLQSNYRSQKEIREAALAVNRQQTGILDRLPAKRSDQSIADLPEGCFFWEQTPNTGQLRMVLDEWANYHYVQAPNEGRPFIELIRQCQLPFATSEFDDHTNRRLDELFTQLNRGRLLTLIRETPWGCIDINRYMEFRLRKHFGADAPSLFPGVPILITQNDQRRELFNGDVGLTLATEAGKQRVVFPRRGRYTSFGVHELPAHELGFALTVHKSQGSEYDQVLLVVPPSSGRRLLCKELIYTAITRAKKRAILYGTKEALQTAIGRCIVRESGIVTV